MNLQLGFNVKKTIQLKTKEKMVNKDGFSTKRKADLCSRVQGEHFPKLIFYQRENQ